jgi:thiamine transport system permease protein
MAQAARARVVSGRNKNTHVLWLMALPLILAVAFSFAIPYGASFWGAFSAKGEISVTENAVLLRVTIFTLKQAFFSVLVSLALGLPGAWFIAGGRSRFTPILRTLTAIPFAMPSILVVLGFVLFYGNSGWLNRLFSALPAAITGTSADPLRILYKPGAVILAHGFFNFPLVVRLVGDGLARVRKAYAPAAASLGACPFITLLTVILPLAIPSLMSAVLLVFLYSFTSFAVVLVLGGGPASTTLSVEIYRYARIFLNYRSAGVLALMETLIAVLFFLGFSFFGKKSREIKADIQERMMEREKRNIPSRIIIAIYGIVLVFFVLGPLLSIPLESLLSRPSHAAVQVFSLRWWRSGRSCLPALFHSLVLAFFSATVACVLAFFAAGTIKIIEIQGRENSRGILLIRFFAVAPVISSGIVLGLGWLIVYGRTLSRVPLALVILHAVIALPFAFNSISEGFRSLPVNTLNAASVFGAGPLTGLFTTALPLTLPRMRSAWGFAAALSMGELNAVMMLGVEGWETLPLYIYRAVGAYRYGEACAGGTLLILGCAAGFLLAEGSLLFERGRKKNA